MSSRRVNIYFIRFVVFANACVFLYLAWEISASDFAGPRSRSEIGLIDSVLFLAVMIFLVAFVTSFRKEITGPQWLLI
ncbi:MAG: hypothetical protein WBE52_03810, partial [Terriglobales bacterium]